MINEVTRGITDRTEYEKASREIRYSFYKEILKKYENRKLSQWMYTIKDSKRKNSTGVIFGHHIGDVQENVISNIMR